MHDKIDALEKSIGMINDLIETYHKTIEERMKGLTKTVAHNEESLTIVTDTINDLGKVYVNQETLNSKISDMEKKTEKKISGTLEKSLERDTLINLQTQINDLKAKMQKIPETIKTNSITMSSIYNDDFEAMDEYLRENIGDVIEDLYQGEKFDVFREYLIEIIYSKKPIVALARNSIWLCEILASIISGGNYHILSFSSGSTDDELLEKIEAIPTVGGNKVVLIRNKFDVSDCGYILNYIKTRPFNEKFIFEMQYDKEAYFVPIEFLNTFNFFFGKANDSKIEYRYVYDFKNERKEPITNINYTNFLESIGISMVDKKIMNEKYYGLLAYSIIPFVAINLEVDIEELINKSLDHDIRMKCEAVLND